jgi:hypothetical protein
MRKIMFLFLITLFVSCDNNDSGSSSSFMSASDTSKQVAMEITSDKILEDELSAIEKTATESKAVIIEESWNNKKEIDGNCNLTLKVPSIELKKLLDDLESKFNVTDFSISAFKPKKEVEEAKEENYYNERYIENDIVFSYIYINLKREIGIKESFIIGYNKGYDALKQSIEGIVPFFTFIIPYLIIFYLIYLIFRFTTRIIFSKKE